MSHPVVYAETQENLQKMDTESLLEMLRKPNLVSTSRDIIAYELYKRKQMRDYKTPKIPKI